MDQYAGSDDLELVNWEERLQALMQIWPWINYAVVWKLTPDKRALVWNTGYIDCNNDRSSQLLHGGRTNSDHSQRLAAIFYSIFKSCKFTNPSSGYAAKAFSRQSPLWWTSCNSPPLPTDPRKEKFLQNVQANFKSSSLIGFVCLIVDCSQPVMIRICASSSRLLADGSKQEFR
ncbi:unnamed protein product [Sphagnum balticum]